MGSDGTSPVALMSIEPEFAFKLLSGEKQVEFRKIAFSSPITHVLIYATNPIKQLVGFFEVDVVEVGSPSSLWERYKKVGGITRSRFRDYYEGHAQGVAIKVKAIQRFADPISLPMLDPTLKPPQSFQYLPAETLLNLGPSIVSGSRQARGSKR